MPHGPRNPGACVECLVLPTSGQALGGLLPGMWGSNWSGGAASAGPGLLGSALALTLAGFGTCKVMKDLLTPLPPTSTHNLFGNRPRDIRADEQPMPLF